MKYTLPMHRKDGQLIELGLNASIITWDDGQPATIVMAQDITERKRAEAQIASYVQQLEGAMQARCRPSPTWSSCATPTPPATNAAWD